MRNFDRLFAVDRGDLYIRAQCGLDKRDRNLAVKVVAFSFEERVRCYINYYKQISVGSAKAACLSFTGNPQPYAGINTRRDLK